MATQERTFQTKETAYTKVLMHKAGYCLEKLKLVLCSHILARGRLKSSEGAMWPV